MGLVQGKLREGALVIMDAFALPVEGTETRVDAQSESYEYMVKYTEIAKKLRVDENVVGWYHSHPGYGCWLSGIDVTNQALHQRYQDPFVAIVVSQEGEAHTTDDTHPVMIVRISMIMIVLISMIMTVFM